MSVIVDIGFAVILAIFVALATDPGGLCIEEQAA